LKTSIIFSLVCTSMMIVVDDKCSLLHKYVLHGY
jgi:hypothetical protein